MENLPLQIASGILIAATVMAGFRYAVFLARRGDWGLAVPAGLFIAVMGGGLVLAGLGTIPW